MAGVNPRPVPVHRALPTHRPSHQQQNHLVEEQLGNLMVRRTVRTMGASLCATTGMWMTGNCTTWITGASTTVSRMWGITLVRQTIGTMGKPRHRDGGVDAAAVEGTCRCTQRANDLNLHDLHTRDIDHRVEEQVGISMVRRTVWTMRKSLCASTETLKNTTGT